MRTGSIGGRDVDSLLKTISVEKRTILEKSRKFLIDAGFMEEVEYDPVNVESIFIFSAPTNREVKIILKYKWDLEALFAFPSKNDADRIRANFPFFSLPPEESAMADRSSVLRLDLSNQSDLLQRVTERILTT
jgi:hypothetical protein